MLKRIKYAIIRTDVHAKRRVAYQVNMGISDLYRKIAEDHNRIGLYNIQAISNISSIIENGLLSYEMASKLERHESIALESVQERRDNKQVPNGRPLHCYANLYFDYWNPMLYRVSNQRDDICILRFDFTSLDMDDTVLSDRNAASRYAAFCSPEEGLSKLNFDMIYARYWVDENRYVVDNIKSVKCAEVLVPDMISVECIRAAAVVTDEAKQRMIAAGFEKEIQVRPNLFLGRKQS